MQSRTLILHLAAGFAAVLPMRAAAGDGETPKSAPTPPATPALDPVRRLIGEWVALDEQGKPTDEVVSRFTLTSGGTAVHEVIFPGSDHEMVTLYYQDGEDLVLTHYCMLGNQPHMRAEKNTGTDKLVFRCVGGGNLPTEDVAHMHQGTITFLVHVGDDRIKSEWLMYEKGEVVETAGFDLARKKG